MSEVLTCDCGVTVKVNKYVSKGKYVCGKCRKIPAKKEEVQVATSSK